MKKTVLMTALLSSLVTPVFADVFVRKPVKVAPARRAPVVVAPARRSPVVVVPVRRAPVVITPVVVAPVYRSPVVYTGGLLAAFAAGMIVGDIIDHNQVQQNDMVIVYVDGRRFYQYETNFFIKMPDGNYQVVADPR